MKRALILLALIAPALVLVFFTLVPQADTATPQPIFHFYIVTFIAFASAVVAILLASSLGSEAKPRHRLASMAFGLVGIIFFTHGFATNGALLSHSHPIVAWSAWITLFGSGAVFAVASLDGATSAPKWLSVRRIVYSTVGLAMLYLSIAIFLPNWLTAVQAQIAPWHQRTLFFITLALCLFAAYRLWRTWRVTHSRTDGALAFVAFWLAQASISLHLFTVWHLSWWLYHIVLLISFLFTVYLLLSEYEHARRFRLVPYFIGTALVVTALLGLVASNLFATVTFNAVTDQIKAQTADKIQNEVLTVSTILPPDSTPAQAYAFYAARLTALPFGRVVIYDRAGQAAYPADGSISPVADAERIGFVRVLAGQALVEVHAPDDLPEGYQPAQAVYTLVAYVPLRASSDPASDSIGVLVTVEDASQLSQAIIDARAAGLLIAVVTMGLLFGALLLIVRRGDRIIAQNGAELAAAYADLRRSEGIRDDLNNMIVHDLRNPLTTISASADLLARFTQADQTEARVRFVDNMRSASQRMMSMIDDMLAVSKIEAGELKLKVETTALDQLLTECVNTFAPRAEAEQKHLTADCLPGLAAEIDRALIGRVIDNLIGNAFKYTDDGSGVILVAARSDNGGVRISVRDNGEGVPDDHKERIFDKFAQAPNAQEKSARKGVGLGLAFCRLVVEAHGGQINVTDAPDGGSLFSFLLPRKQNQ
jgi:signal transduction histidine kinase